MNVQSIAFISSRLLARVVTPRPAFSSITPWRLMSTLPLDEKFKLAQQKVGEITQGLSDRDKLKIYGLFKQATEGKNTKKKPPAVDFAGTAKWKAWNNLGDLPQEEAKEKYVNVVNDLLAKFGKDLVA